MAGLGPRCITHSFSRPSPAGGLVAEVIGLGAGSPADFACHDVTGRILLLDGIATPAVSLRATESGAVGQIHISPHEDPHEMCISPVWGNPTPPTRHNLPGTVVLSVGKTDGARGDRFDHDPALGLQPWPVLDALRHLSGTAPESDDAKFAEVSAVRAANRLGHALDTALSACG